ncbi:MAG: hypothetical protein VXX97_10300 [Pseudomonadota bacterium]|nr:hypothetical protein [Pseudomonadota bacterium]
MPNKSTPNNNPREISDLTFNEQVFIWALRMKLRGEEFFKKVVAHCEKNLPPAAARISLNSVAMVINSVRYHGKKSLTLNCTCMPNLSSDELDLITLYRSVFIEQNQINASIASSMVTIEGTEMLVNALLSFHMAMETIDSPVPKQTDRLLVARQKQYEVCVPASKMIH